MRSPSFLLPLCTEPNLKCLVGGKNVGEHVACTLVFFHTHAVVVCTLRATPVPGACNTAVSKGDRLCSRIDECAHAHTHGPVHLATLSTRVALHSCWCQALLSTGQSLSPATQLPLCPAPSREKEASVSVLKVPILAYGQACRAQTGWVVCTSSSVLSTDEEIVLAAPR